VVGGGKQARALETIAAVLEVTRGLIDAHGEQGVRLDEVQRRSGVSSGSIYHHFGDRDGLIAAAQVDRFDRAVRDDARGLVDNLYGAATRGDPEVYLDEVRKQSATVVVPERSAIRWARVTALASAWHRPDLMAALGESFSGLVETLFDGARQLQGLGVLNADLDPRGVAIFSQIHSLGLLLNDLDPRPVSDEDWVHLMQHLVISLSPTGLGRHDEDHDEDHGERSRSEHAHQEQIQREVVMSTRPRPDLLPQSRSRNEQLFGEVVELAAAAMVRGGTTEVRVEDIRTAVGVSSGWFHRRFGGRDGLLDVTRIVLYRRFAQADLDSLERIVEQATTPLHFSEMMRAVLLFTGPHEGLTVSRWQRLEVLAASVGSPVLEHEIRLSIGEATDRAEATVRRAQERGLLLPELPPRAVAHFLASYPFGFLFVALDGDRVTLEAWADLLTRVLRSMQPDIDRSGIE
jgi:AcrR family transcriptional regulator